MRRLRWWWRRRPSNQLKLYKQQCAHLQRQLDDQRILILELEMDLVHAKFLMLALQKEEVL